MLRFAFFIQGVILVTNFENIKNINMDEMADWDLLKCPFHENTCIRCNQFECDCSDCKKDWLESEEK